MFEMLFLDEVLVPCKCIKERTRKCCTVGKRFAIADAYQLISYPQTIVSLNSKWRRRDLLNTRALDIFAKGQGVWIRSG